MSLEAPELSQEDLSVLVEYFELLVEIDIKAEQM